MWQWVNILIFERHLANVVWCISSVWQQLNNGCLCVWRIFKSLWVLLWSGFATIVTYCFVVFLKPQNFDLSIWADDLWITPFTVGWMAMIRYFSLWQLVHLLSSVLYHHSAYSYILVAGNPCCKCNTWKELPVTYLELNYGFIKEVLESLKCIYQEWPQHSLHTSLVWLTWYLS